MAQWNFAFNLSGDNETPIVRKFPVADSQTLKSGDVVVLTSGKVAKAGDGTGRVLGVMAEDATTGAAAGGPQYKVSVAQPGQVWAGQSSADATAHILTGTRTYDMNSSNQVNVADTTGGSLWPLGLIPNKTTTDIYVVFTAVVLG